MSWRRSPETGTLTIWFNRDESRTRSEATAPEVRSFPRDEESDEARWISCIDPDGGGTWLAVNDSGLCVGLLNFYDGKTIPPRSGASFTSRGKLVSEGAAQLKSVDEVDSWLRGRVKDNPYRPFVFVALDASDETVLRWGANQLETRDADLPLTTSSFSTAEVIAERRRYFHEIGGGEKFHCWHDQERPAFSALMSRDDAKTVSLSRIEIVPGKKVAYSYATGPDWEWSRPIELAGM